MWSPTHIQVTVQRAKGLLTKGKNGTNNCFVTIALGKEKYQTSIKEKSDSNVSWNEECELKIPDQGNRAELVLTCLHRNNLAIDEFLGQVTLPLNEMDVYDRPRSKWFKLESKPGKEKKNKERGELEVRVMFTVKSGSLTDLSKKEKHKSSIGKLAGSVMSLGEKRKGMKNFAKSLGSKMNLRSKNKNKDGDDASSFSGSFVSIGTPNSSVNGSRRYNGQMAGEADPGVISEDEDEFKFDNLSPKSSTSSLNMPAGKLRLPTQNHEPRNPSPLLRNGKFLGKQYETTANLYEEEVSANEKQEKNNNNNNNNMISPPSPLQTPSKPPRSAQTAAEMEQETNVKLNEWETKLYGKHLDNNSSDSLKRRSWDLNPVRLPILNESAQQASININTNKKEIPTTEIMETNNIRSLSTTSSSSSSSEVETPQMKVTTVPAPTALPKTQQPRINLLSHDEDKVSNDFDQLNATFAQFEQRNSSKIYDSETDEKKWYSQSFIDAEAQQAQQSPKSPPQAKPRQREIEQTAGVELEEVAQQKQLKEKEQAAATMEAERKRAKEDARLEAELRLNEQRLHDKELALQQELKQQQEELKNRREIMRREEDERILNFAKKRSISVEEAQSPLPVSKYASTTPEQSPKQRVGENREKRFGKFKYFNKRDKNEAGESSSSSPKSHERIIIGHEKATSHSDRRSEITAALAKKYEGKSREELMLIANGMENEALMQRQRVKELEDYLDNLLLRVMETHPKILQNPYSRTTLAKSG